MNQETPKFVRWAVLLGIVVLLNAFTFIGIAYFFPEPTYDDFHPRMMIEGCYSPGNACADESSRVTQSAECIACMQAEQAEQIARSEALEAARKAHAQNAFITVVLIGALALIAGIFLKGSSIVSAGLSFGGVIILFAGSVRWLWQLDAIIQLLVVGLALLAVIAVAYRKFRD